jgi:cytochrome c oxidase subunit 2
LRWVFARGRFCNRFLNHCVAAMTGPDPILAAGSVLRVFAPDSPQASAIFHLAIICSIIFALIYVIVAGVIVFSVMRFRWREGEPDPTQVPGNRRLEIIWTVIPFMIVILLFVLTARTMTISDPPPAPKPDVVVIGHQWWWEYRYPDTGVVAVNELHIPVGKPLSLRLDAVDVLHEFWVPELTRKMTTVPGHPNHIWLQANKPGTYLGVCSEFCGTEHAWMHFLVIAESQDDFDVWTKAQLQPAAAPEGDAAKGLALFQQLSCASCHAVKGTSATAQVAPDLTHIAGRRQLAAGIVDNTPDNLHRWLANPGSVKPGVLMPNFNLTDEQVNQLVAYFETLK